MSEPLVLDSEAFSALGHGRGSRRQHVKAAMEVSWRLARPVLVPAVVLAELYRGAGRNQVVDACLSRETGISVRDTDRTLARYVGGVLAGARVGSEHLVDAHVIAVAVEQGGGAVLSTDRSDLEMLASPYPSVTVHRLP